MSDDAARLRALLEIAQLVGSARRLEDFIEVAADAARRALDAASLSVSRWDRETGMLRILCNVGQLGPGELRLPVDETYTIAGWDAMPELVERRVSFTAAVDDRTPEGDHLADRHKDSHTDAHEYTHCSRNQHIHAHTHGNRHQDCHCHIFA